MNRLGSHQNDEKRMLGGDLLGTSRFRAQHRERKEENPVRKTNN